MSQSPVTRKSLLLRLRDTDDSEAWSDFVHLYAPLVHAYCLKRGLQDADASDAAQEVLSSISKSIPGFDYDPRKGSFRGWVFQITRNQLTKYFHHRQKLPKATGETSFQQALEQQLDPAEERDVWDREYQRRVFQWAVEKVQPEFKPTTWNAFRMVSIESRSASDAASELGLSIGAIYIAKSRVTSRLRAVIQAVEPE
ncbi:MAG: RNA polymerase sigma factor [Planctomycetota bacterium]